MSIPSELLRLQSAKTTLKAAIENGGVTVQVTAKIDAYPALVAQITEQFNAALDEINGEVI